MIHKDHVTAVLDIDFSPTGREFVTGSFDKTIRIFPFINIVREIISIISNTITISVNTFEFIVWEIVWKTSI